MVVVVLLAGVIHLRRLGDVPVNIWTDEARFALQARSIAATGRDMLGNRLPLFFNMIDPLTPDERTQTWWQPTLFYLAAAAFLVAPFSEWAVRAPVACLAILDVILMYAVGRRLFSNRWYAVFAALLLAFTPVHVLIGRLATDYFLPVPFALAWLCCLLLSLERASAWLAALTGIVLGVGTYSYITSWMVMPLYLVVTAAVFHLAGKPLTAIVALVGGFALPLLPLIPWLWFHPTMPREIFGHYQVAASSRWLERVDVYWRYFNPSFLFFSGGANLMFGTRTAGVFLVAVAALVPLGIWNAWRVNPAPARWVIVLAFLLVPMPVVATLPVDPNQFAPRVLLFVPFGVLLSALGLEWLIAERGRVGRLVAALLVLSIPVQFTFFIRDYFTDYQRRSADRFDDLHLRAVADYVISTDAATRIPAVYFAEDSRESRIVQWKFYLLTRNRLDIWDRTRYFVPARDLAHVAPGSLLVHSTLMAWVTNAIAHGKWSIVRTVDGVSGDTAAVIRRWE